MAQFFTDFSEYAVSTFPNDWSSAFDGYGASEIESQTYLTGGKGLRIKNLSEGNSTGEWGATWNKVSAVSNVELYARIYVRGTSFYIFPSLGARIGSKKGNLGGGRSSTDVILQKYSAFGPAIVKYATVPAYQTVGEFTHVRFKITSSEYKIKVWKDNDPEPVSWTLTQAETSPHPAGLVGFWVKTLAGNVSSQPTIDLFGVGTDGDPAPTSAQTPSGQLSLTLTQSSFVQATLTSITKKRLGSASIGQGSSLVSTNSLALRVATTISQSSSIAGTMGIGLPISQEISQGSALMASPSIKQALRLGAAIETGSSLQATPGLALSLSCTAEQDSSLEAAFGQNSVLASTLVQGSAVSAGIKLRLPLSLSSISLEQGTSLTAIAGQALPMASTIAQDSSLQGSLTLALPLAATVEQDSALLASAVSGLPLSALSETQSQVLGSTSLAQALPLSSTIESGSDLPAALRIGAGFQTTLEQGSSLQAGLGLGLRLSSLLAQSSGLEATGRVGAGLVADIYTDSTVSAAIGVGVRLSGMVDQPSTIIAGLAYNTAIRLESAILAPAALSATMASTTLAGAEATLEQASALALSMAVAVPAGPSLIAQSSAMQVALKVSIPLEAVAEQGSELAPALQTPLRLTTAFMQESEVGVAELRTDKRFSTTIATQTALVVALDAPHYAGEVAARLEQGTELAAGLKVSLRFKSVLPQPQAALLAASKKTRALKLAPIQNAGLVRTILRVPALGSTGWLTVSDIFFHNDYYSEVVFEHVPASEITLVPALRIDTLSIMPA